MNNRPTVGIAGTFQVGKSCLINLLLGQICTPVGDGLFSKTKAQIIFRYGLDEYVVFENCDGSYIISNIEEFVKNYDSYTSYSKILVYLNSQILQNIDFVDIPGINANEEEDSIAYSAFDSLDHVIIVNKNTRSIDAVIINLIRYLNERNIPYTYVINCFYETGAIQRWDPLNKYNKDQLAHAEAKIATRTSDLLIDREKLGHSAICINLAWAAYGLLSNNLLGVLFPHGEQIDSLDLRLQEFCSDIKVSFNKISKTKWLEASKYSVLLSELDGLIKRPTFSSWELGEGELYNRGMTYLRRNNYKDAIDHLEEYKKRVVNRICRSRNITEDYLIKYMRLHGGKSIKSIHRSPESPFRDEPISLIDKLVDVSFALGILYITGSVTGVPEIEYAKRHNKMISLMIDSRKCLNELIKGNVKEFNPLSVKHFHRYNYCDGKTSFEPTIVRQDFKNIYIDFELEGVSDGEMIVANIGLTTQFSKEGSWEYVKNRFHSSCILNHIADITYRLYIGSIPSFFGFFKDDYWTEVSEVKVILENIDATKKWPYFGEYFCIKVLPPYGKETMLKLKDVLPNDIFKLK